MACNNFPKRGELYVAEKNYRIYLKGKDRTSSVANYEFIGDKYKVTFNNGKQFIYNACNVQIEESALNSPESRACFEYLKQIAEVIGLYAEVEPGKRINILANSYEKNNFVSPRSMLAAFLNGKLTESYTASILNPVYPFGFNASQKDAVDKALNNRLSVIEGPPGTGKTQTILNIIANAVMRDESAAVVSSNNSATKNVVEKLEKYGVDFIAAYLGNSDNKRDFINSRKSLPDMSDWKLKPQTAAQLHKALKTQCKALSQNLLLKNELSILKQELSSVEIEQKHFFEYANSVLSCEEPQIHATVGNSESALEMWLLTELYEESKQESGIGSFINSLFEWFTLAGRRKRKIKQLLESNSREQLISAYQRRFYVQKISELTQSITACTLELKSFDFNAKMDEYSKISMELLRDKLARKYSDNKRAYYKLDDLKKKSEDFIKDYPVILSTTYSLRSSLSSGVMYDYVIVDESSQVDLCTGALAMSCAKKAIIVGDLKQLPNVVDGKTSAITDKIFTESDLPEVYRYNNHSLLSTVTELFPDVPNTLLREHYRCHPKIIEFCNQKFYGGQLITLTEPKSAREPLIVYKTAEGNHERNRMNQRQIDVILSEIIPEQNLNIQDNSLGIVTPYRNQTNALQKAFVGTGVKADTVDKFQGQENEVIILSTVDNEITEFTDNANRLNVAVSRAIEQLILVVSDSDMQIDTNIGDLVRYIEYNNFSVVDSKVYSVFDSLYKSYSEHYQALPAKRKRVSEYDSENLMFELIKSVINNKHFLRFDVAVHVPLKMIIRNIDSLNTDEKRYAENALTHVDFLIYSRIDKTPRLVVEVDGVAFHTEGSRQAERDKIKNEILRKCSLPIIRFRTDGSGERNRLIKELEVV